MSIKRSKHECHSGFKNGVYVMCITSEQRLINISLIFSHLTMTTAFQLGVYKDFTSKLKMLKYLWKHFDKMPKKSNLLTFPSDQYPHTTPPLQCICHEQCGFFFFFNVFKNSRKGHVLASIWTTAAMWRRLRAIDRCSVKFTVLHNTFHVISAELFCVQTVS